MVVVERMKRMCNDHDDTDTMMEMMIEMLKFIDIDFIFTSESPGCDHRWSQRGILQVE